MQGKLNEAEYTAYKVFLKTSKLKAVLNEKPPSKTQMVELPEPVGGCIVPEFSTQSNDDQDIFADPRIKRMPEIAKA